MNCVLCGENSNHFFTDTRRKLRYYRCSVCDLRFLNPEDRLSQERELSRYLKHQNCVDDPGYQLFVDPMYQLILSQTSKDSSCLDFGCGSGSVLSHLLTQHGYDVTLYDPFFMPNGAALECKYDLIFAIEVIEHFYHPAREFVRLKELLRPSGSLAFMTFIYSDQINFETWSYRSDPTHVCFYSQKTFEWIQAHWHFKSLRQFGDRVVWIETE